MNNAAFNDIARIIHGKPAAAISQLPQVWQELARGIGNTGLSEAEREAYVEAAQLFTYHGTPMQYEAMVTLAADFSLDRYPDFTACRDRAETPLAQKTVAALEQLFGVFGHSVPAAFYNVVLATVLRDDTSKSMTLFKGDSDLMQDRLWDAVLHGALLVTPIGLYVQSVFSKHGLRLQHMMNCSCITSETTDAPFNVSLDRNLLPAYLQNMLAAAFEQYGTNASTSRSKRGF